MSDTYPAGFYPVSSTVPAKWTDAPSQPGIVQFNGLVYVKTERHTGGTGKPNEEEVDGIRTWQLYTTNQPSTPCRYLWSHLHTVLRHYSPDYPVYDEDCYSSVSQLFFLYPNQLSASIDQNIGRTVPSNLRLLLPRTNLQDFVSYDAASGMFDKWSGNVTGDPFFPYGYCGWASANPDTGGSVPTPDPLPTIQRQIVEHIFPAHPVAVGKTYTGYLQRIEATGSWVFNPDTGLHDYILSTPYVAEQIPLTYTVTQQDFTDALENTTPSYSPTTFTATATTPDLWVGWGFSVLTGVSPNADA